MKNYEIAIFGGGCFWCVEAVFQRLEGVLKVESGYMGGHIDNPSYKEICTGTTGHAEVAKITFDPSIISFETLLEVFWTSHDPTTLNRQGNDKGTQYRSVIFFQDENQKRLAENSVQEVASKLYSEAIVTEISPNCPYYPAEQYHQNYFERNGYAPYCRFVIQPKVVKLKKEHKALLKSMYRE